VNLHERGEECECRRDGGGNADLVIRDGEELRHDEGGGPHDRRHDLAHRRGRRLNAAREMGRVSGPLHQRDGKGARGHRVGDGAARNHPEERAGNDSSLCGSPLRPAGQRKGDVGEELPGARLPQQRAVEDEQQDEVGRHPDRNAEDPVRGKGEVGAESLETVSLMGQEIREIRAEQCVTDEDDGNHRDSQAGGPPGRLEYDQHQDRAHQDVH